MNTQQAVETLWKSGYRANASRTLPGYVVVLDRSFTRLVIHASLVPSFLTKGV